MKMSDIAFQISAHLERFERDPLINIVVKTTQRFFHAGAYVAGRYVAVTYVSYQGPTNLNKKEALVYLAALDGGSSDRHYEVFHKNASQ